jgi:crotonobetainyl-CoA:carnitine CoA-transferase CaiB-like acyl-CoA transferase
MSPISARRAGRRASQPPRIGEHNAEMLSEAGFTAREIAKLAGAAIIAASSPGD